MTLVMMPSNIFQICLFFVVWPVFWMPFGIFLSLSLGWKPFQPLSPLQKLPFVLSLYAIAPLVLAGVLSWSDLSWLSIGWSSANLLSGSFFLGLLISVLSIGGLFSLFCGLDWIKLRSFESSHENAHISQVNDSEDSALSHPSASQTSSPWRVVPALLVLGVIVGGIEELIFRGFLTGRLSDSLSVWLAGAIASCIFALLHLVWEGSETIPQLPGLWVMGMVLTIAWWVDQQAIALAWGLHAGWVWSIATFDSLGIIQYSGRVPEWVTGIDHKPLAGIMGVGALVLTGLGIFWGFNLPFFSGL